MGRFARALVHAFSLPRVVRLLLAALAVVCAGAGVAGCSAASGTLLAPAPAEDEAYNYFPSDATAVFVVSTDPEGDQLRALLQALPAALRDELRAAGRRVGLVPAQLRSLLGNDLVLGVPRPGAPPLAVLVTRDGEALQILADSRVTGRRARVAGTYRGAQLYAARGHAFAVRGPVVLVGATTEELRAALDRRAGKGESVSEEALRRALPRTSAGRPLLAWGVVDAEAVVSRAGERARAVPWLAATDRLGLTVRAVAGGPLVDVRLDTGAEDLVERDVPVTPGTRAPRTVRSPAAAVGVRDLAHVIGLAERAAAAAFPLAHLRYAQARGTLRRAAGVDPGGDVARYLHGHATLIRGADGWLLHARPSRPEPLRRAIDRAARELPAALARARLLGWDVRRHADLHVVSRDGRAVGAFGVVDGVLVAGTAAPEAVRALARAPVARPPHAAGGLVFDVPADQLATALLDGAPGLSAALAGRRIRGWLRGDVTETVGRLRLDLRSGD